MPKTLIIICVAAVGLGLLISVPIIGARSKPDPKNRAKSGLIHNQVGTAKYKIPTKTPTIVPDERYSDSQLNWRKSYSKKKLNFLDLLHQSFPSKTTNLDQVLVALDKLPDNATKWLVTCLMTRDDTQRQHLLEQLMDLYPKTEEAQIAMAMFYRDKLTLDRLDELISDWPESEIYRRIFFEKLIEAGEYSQAYEQIAGLRDSNENSWQERIVSLIDEAYKSLNSDHDEIDLVTGAVIGEIGNQSTWNRGVVQEFVMSDFLSSGSRNSEMVQNQFEVQERTKILREFISANTPHTIIDLILIDMAEEQIEKISDHRNPLRKDLTYRRFSHDCLNALKSKIAAKPEIEMISQVPSTDHQDWFRRVVRLASVEDKCV